jgi:deoxyribodipyrimidine photolyase-related protein
MKARNLIIVLGDQLNADSSAFDGADRRLDAVLMMEVKEEATYIRQHKLRIALFLSAMRHFRDELVTLGWRVLYREIDDPGNGGSFARELKHWVPRVNPSRLVVAQPGDYRVRQSLVETARALEVELDIREDSTFFCSRQDFEDLSGRSGKIVLENFYRRMRREHGILMSGTKPEGGRWNFDPENRKPISPGALRELPEFRGSAPDEVTREAMKAVERLFPDSPGRLDLFDYPVTSSEARRLLRDFVARRLPNFGPYQDAMATGRPYLYHSRLSSAFNMRLLKPREAVDAAVEAYNTGQAPLASVEGFVRQILGWREFVWGVYWKYMPGYAAMNALDAEQPVPEFLWTAETDMNCVRHAVSSLIDHAYTHHIQRLMVLGLYCLLRGVHPRLFHEWHMSMFADAIDWVSLPNALGMSQFADGGIMGTKPYCASGNYINRMSDYCGDCRYNPLNATGDDACPFTTLYWDFLHRNRERFKQNARMRLQLANLARHPRGQLVEIRRRADRITGRL